jgi:hypothetical protein
MSSKSSQRLMIAVVGAFLAVFAVGGSAAQASVAGSMPGSHRLGLAPDGIGYGNGVKEPYPMLSAPVNGAHYVGTAYPGDDLADACYIVSGTLKWQLVLDRNGHSGDHYPATAGFLPQTVLTSDPVNGAPCPPTFYTDNVGQNGLSTMYSSPHADSYVVGTAHGPTSGYAGDSITDLCAVTVGNTPWIWVLDANGWAGDHFANTTGFLPYWDLVNSTNVVGIPC